MNINTNKPINSEKGFTLVELAIVMVIIGLLIGGVLKGQELIANAQLNSTIADIKGLSAATSTFRDVYDALPGDMSNATTRIQGCADPCDNGDGDAAIGTAPLVATPDAEAGNFFRHLAGADLLTGFSVIAPANTYLQMKIPMTQLVPGTQAALALGNADAGVARSGIWVGLVATGATGNTIALTPLQAARIDRKMDDGNAERGSVVGSGDDCASDDGVYAEGAAAIGCAIAVRLE